MFHNTALLLGQRMIEAMSKEDFLVMLQFFQFNSQR